jgi:hypothetical protein
MEASVYLKGSKIFWETWALVFKLWFLGFCLTFLVNSSEVNLNQSEHLTAAAVRNHILLPSLCTLTEHQ